MIEYGALGRVALNLYTYSELQQVINLLMPNDDYSGPTAPLTSKHFI